MAGSLEGNKIVAAVLTAGIIASASGFLSRAFYSPETIEEDAYPITVAESEDQQDDAPAVEPVAVRLASAAAADGEQVATKCSSCHSFDEGGPMKVGPNLYDIVGEPIGEGDYAFSSALADYGEPWNYENLDGFLENPREWAPGTKMSFVGLSDPEQRADMIMYLRSLAAEQEPLPEVPEEAPDTAETVTEEDESPEGQATASAEGTEEPTPEDTSEAVAASSDEASSDEEEVSATAQPSTDAEQQTADAAEDVPSETPVETEEQAAQSSEPEQQPAGEQQQMAAATTGEEASTAEDAASGGSFGAILASADPGAGEAASRQCMACHTFNEGGPNRVGPNLYGIVQSPIGESENGFAYSQALADHGGEWTYQNLDAFLANPREWAPGTKMSFVGIKDEQKRAEVIAYLRTLANEPPPLP